jgi:hypothetical protein
LRFSRPWLWKMPSSGMLCHVTLVRTDVLEERSTSIIKVTGIGELGTTLAVTSNRSTLRRNELGTMLAVTSNRHMLRRLLVTAKVVPSSQVRWRRYDPPKHQFLEEPPCVTSQKTLFFFSFSYLRSYGSTTKKSHALTVPVSVGCAVRLITS